MTLHSYEAVRFEAVMVEGRTLPVILACRRNTQDPKTEPKVVKAIGCPELTSIRSLVCEVVGNALARRLGNLTPEPCLVNISSSAATGINASLKSLGHHHSLVPGPAAGCSLLKPSPAPLALQQSLTPEQRIQAARLFVFDMLCQNADRRPDKPNCGVADVGIVAFDFEMCFAHLWIPVLGQSGVPAWNPSRTNLAARHLFYSAAKSDPPGVESIEASLMGLTDSWWNELLNSLPDSWRTDAVRVGEMIFAVREHAVDFAKDIHRSLM